MAPPPSEPDADRPAPAGSFAKWRTELIAWWRSADAEVDAEVSRWSPSDQVQMQWLSRAARAYWLLFAARLLLPRTFPHTAFLLLVVQTALKLFSCWKVLWRFRPFREGQPCSMLDRRLAFNTAAFLFAASLAEALALAAQLLPTAAPLFARLHHHWTRLALRAPSAPAAKFHPARHPR